MAADRSDEDVDLDELINDPKALLAIAKELQEGYLAAEAELVRKEDEIADLTKDLKSAGRRKRGGGGNEDARDLEEKLTQMREEHEAEMEELMALRDTYGKLKNDHQNTLDDLTTARTQEQYLNKRISEMQKEISDLSASARATTSKAQNVNKQKSDAQEEARKLRQENVKLQDELDNALADLSKVTEEKEIALHLTTELIEQKEELAVQQNSFDVVRDELQSRYNALEFDFKKVNEELTKALDHSDFLNRIDELETALKKAKETAAMESARDKKEIEALRAKVNEMSVSSEAGRKQAELDNMSKEHEDMAAMLGEMKTELDAALQDKSILADKLFDMEQNEAQRFNEKLFDEREKIRILEHNYDTLRANTEDDKLKSVALEKEVGDLHREVDELKHWKSVYEEDKGWDELLYTNSKLKNDNRMLLGEVERAHAKVGFFNDANSLLQTAFDRLKIEAGKPADFQYPEYELKTDQKVGTARLEAEMLVLEDQVNNLDTENMKLRKALRSAAGSFGENGFKFAGMKPEQLIKVNEFAQNLRDGKIELPESETSVEMSRELRRLKEDRVSLQAKIDAFEKGGAMPMGVVSAGDSATAAPGAGTGATAHVDSSYAEGLREDIRKLHVENSELRTRMASMQSEVIGLIRNQAGHTIEHTESISAVMHAHNETLLNELKALKESGVAMAASRGRSTPGASPRNAPAATPATVKIEAPADVARAAAAAATAAAAGDSASAGKPPRPHAVPASMATPAATPEVQFTTPGAPYSSATGDIGQTMNVTIPFTQPNTPHGKVLLNKTLTQMNLPSEDWVDEVKELNGQLVECLEQLHERELELSEQHTITSTLEESLISIKQQMAALYHDFANKAETWEKREKEYKDSCQTLLYERDDLKLKLKRSSELTDHMKKGDPEALENKLVEATRKMAVLETNESVLSRKYCSLQEIADKEREERQKLEADFVEMESSLKQRILYLEQYKSTASARMTYLQGKLESSVSRVDFEAAHKELEYLREEHLSVLRREVEARVAMVEGRESKNTLRALRLDYAMMQSELEAAKANAANLTSQLEHQRETTERVLASKANAELSSVVSDMAVFRGEAGRLEVELASSRRKADAAMEQCKLLTKETEIAYAKLDELTGREEEAVIREDEARKEALKTMLKYDGGLPREQAEELKKRVEKLTASAEDAQREATKFKELAQVSSLQAQTIASFRNAKSDEISELRDHCARLEARSDDDILIGRLQRQLISTKYSYKQFVQKYQMLRGGMRQRELQIRLLEAKLDQRESTVATMQDEHSAEVSALKKALRNVKNLTEGDPFLLTSKPRQRNGNGGAEDKENRKPKPPVNPGYVTVGMKMSKLSEKVRTLSDLTDVSVSKAKQAEEESAELEGKVQGLQTELQIMSQRCQDLERSIEKGGKSKAHAIASRLVTLSEEVRSNKLTCLQQRRQIQVLRQEKKHLQSLLQQTEMNVEDLEVGKVISDTKDLLGDIDGGALAGGAGAHQADLSLDVPNVALDTSVDTTGPAALPTKPAPKIPGGVVNTAKDRKLTIDTSLDSAGIGAGDSSAELVSKLEQAMEELASARRDASNAKLSRDKHLTQLTELESALREKEDQISYYEKMAQREGLPGMRGLKSGSGSASPGRSGTDKQVRVMKEEQHKLQEAAGATISSMKALLDEKNRLIESYRNRIEDLTSAGDGGARKKSKADRKAEALLEKLENEDKDGRHPGKFDGAGLGSGLTSEGHQKLLNQIDQADNIIQEKDREIRELEQKLAQVHNMRERAETRCGTTLQEMEAMKTDMITLAQQLQMSEDRLKRATGRTVTSKNPVNPDERRILELTKSIKVKEEKIRGYREIIVRLKDEFIKSEEERALTGGAAGSMRPENTLDAEEFRDLKNQISSLRSGLTQAKQDLEEAKRTREKISKARSAAQKEVTRLEGQVGRAESQAAAAQESLLKTRKDLEETRRKEIRLRDKLKELLESDGGADKLKDLKTATQKAEHFEKEVELLRAQNLALRRAAEEQSQQMAASGAKSSSVAASAGAGTLGSTDTGKPSQFPPNVGASGTAFSGTANVLGSGADGPQDELRQQLHAKWESEKKLQKRLTVVEKRLHEKLAEIEDLTSQLQRAREMTQQALQSKEEYAKKASAASKKATDRHSAGNSADAAVLEEAHNKIFDLEEANARLRRQAEVEQVNEINKMRHTISGLQMRVGELENELAESETRRKTAAAGGKRTLRDSEDKYLREERLKDDLDILKKQKIELEAAILDRDARAIENRFDLEAKDQETERLRKRIKELEAAYRTTAAAAGSPMRGGVTAGSVSGGPGGGSTAGKSGSRREADLEGTIEAMKRVVDKLKAENDRYRKAASGGDANRAADVEKKLQSQKQKADKLEDEIAGLRAKLKGHEESSQKLVQRQQQISAMRKQLKSKDEELEAIKQSAGGASEEVDNLRRKLKTYEDRITSLESSLTSAQSRGGRNDEVSQAMERELAELRQRATKQATDIESLRAQLAIAERAAAPGAGMTFPAPKSAASGGLDGPAKDAEITRLRDENEKLRQELSAFDMDFFEEIENLKYAHAEAVKKLRVYESAAGR